MTGEQAIALGKAFANKVTAISCQPELTPRDVVFLDKAAESEVGLQLNDYLANNLQHLLAQYEMHEAQVATQ